MIRQCNLLEIDQSCWGICLNTKPTLSQLNFTAFGRSNSGIHTFVRMNCFICNISGEIAKIIFVFHLFCAQCVIQTTVFY
jgi:hypothetical protein